MIYPPTGNKNSLIGHSENTVISREVGSGLHNKFARIGRMSWAEVRTRISQDLSKRVDLARYRLRIPSTPGLRQAAIAPKFLFDASQGNLPGRAALLRIHLPHEIDATIQAANDICRHKYDLLGYEGVDYGPSIDWHLDPIHRKRSPLVPWFKVPFLDFNVVGDHKIVWELNRHQHLVTLAKAWVLTGNGKYASECAAQFYAWQAENPYPLGINWASTLEVAFRSLSWLWIRCLLASCVEPPDTFQTDLLLALQSHGQHIDRYLSTYFSPNTHLLGEAVALFFLGTLCPQIVAAERWQTKGWQIVLEESKRQVRPDGVYFEQSLYYHVYALDLFLYARILASRNGIGIPDSFDEVIRKMLAVVDALSSVGPPEGCGDDDGGRLFNPRRNRVEHMRDPLALGAVVYDAEYSSATLTEEAIWWFGEKAASKLTTQTSVSRTQSRAFEAGGIYIIQDQEPYPQQMIIDAGPQGTGNSGHGHADALSIRYSLNGCRFLIDSGTYCYVSEGGDRNRFRGTAAHNTLRVDELDQAISEGPFAWSSIPDVKAERWLNARTFDFFVGCQNGYKRLPDPVLHRRYVFHLKGGLWFIQDSAEGQGKHILETFWHFAPDLRLRTHSSGGVVAASSEPSTQPASLRIVTDTDSGWTSQMIDTLVSPSYGAKQSTHAFRISGELKLPANCGVLLIPMLEANKAGKLTRIAASADGVCGYRYQTGVASEFFFFAAGGTAWSSGDWSSDAELLYCKVTGDAFGHVIMVNGSFAEWRGKKFLSHPSSIQMFEWTRDARFETPSTRENTSDLAVITNFEFSDFLTERS